MARTDEAITKIRDLIVRGELAPGSRLPPEKELCAMLGMSRGSMREAVKALEMAKVLDVRRGDGTYVTSLEPELLLDGIGFAVQLLQDDNLADLMHLRRVLEAEATALATANVDDALLEELSTLLDRMRSSTDVEELVAHDMAFHERIVAACGNPTLASLLKGLSSRTQRARIWRGISERDAFALTIAQHGTIYDALAERDVDAARAASLVHVATSERWLRGVVDSETAGPDAATD